MYSSLYSNQYRFRADHCIDLAHFRILRIIYRAWESRQSVIVFMMDLSKAFDTSDNSILLLKLESYDTLGSPHSWLKSYLSHRNQFNKVHGRRSSKAFITCGVLQGSILGPLLFLIYINNIHNYISSGAKLILYAGDCNHLLPSFSDCSSIPIVNQDLSNLLNWYMGCKLSQNHSKTKGIILQTREGKLHVIK